MLNSFQKIIQKNNIIHRYLVILFFILLVCLFLCSAVLAEQPPAFKLHGRFVGIGSNLATIIGPGREQGTERLYASHINVGNPLDIVAVDPLTGEADVFTSPLFSEFGSWGMVLGPDGQVYIGTLPNAHIMRVDWKSKKLVDMGRPSNTEQYIWQLATGSDKNIYGCTYPSAKLIRFNPYTGKSDDLGRMSSSEQYGRFIAADNTGFVYIGIGFANRDLVAYEIATGKYRSILPNDMKGPGVVTVVRGQDGAVYAAAGKWLRLNGYTTTLVAENPGFVSNNAGLYTLPLRLSDGRRATYDGKSVSLQNQHSMVVQSTRGYFSKDQGIFRIGLGPNNLLFGSTAMPGHFFWASPENDQWQEIAKAGEGEIYSFLPWQNKLIVASYSFPSPIMIYRPDHPLWKPGQRPEDNPWQIHYDGENAGWRPMAMIAGPQEKIYIGAVPGYGLLGGPLCVLDPVTGKVDQYSQVVQDQSVVALAVTAEGMLVGGTAVFGGSGSRATQTGAKIFLWDPIKREKVFETIEVSRSSSIEALGVGQNGLVYGFASRGVMFVFDPKARKIISTSESGIGHVIYNAIGRGADGKLYGLHSGGIFTIDEKMHKTKQIAAYSPGVTGGFVILGKRIYFTSGPQIVSYMLP